MNPAKRKKLYRMSLRANQTEQSQEEVVEQKVETPIVVVEPIVEEIAAQEPATEVKVAKKKKSV